MVMVIQCAYVMDLGQYAFSRPEKRDYLELSTSTII